MGDGLKIERHKSASKPHPTAEYGQGKQRPACFEPTSILFTGSGFDGPYDRELDRLQAGMLDGRTIHFHFQFVEPELIARYPAATVGMPGFLEGALSPRRLFEYKSQSFTKQPHTEVECSYGSTYSLLCCQQDLVPLHALVMAALQELAKTGLDWLPVLSIGAFALETDMVQAHAHCAVVALSSSPSEAAARVTAQAAFSLAQMWVEAEWLRGHHSQDAVEAARAFAGDLLASLFLTEFGGRSGHPSYGGLPPDPREEVLADFPLTRHLINFWDRGWNRQAFLSGSAFDHAPTLEALYEGWRP